MEKISDHVTYLEAVDSQTAVRKGIDNTPTQAQLAAMVMVAKNAFEPLRAWYGKPIIVSSFFRCPALNKAIGGAIGSQHEKGEAMDLNAGKDNVLLFNWLRANVKFDQLIWEFGDDSNPSWVHVSYASKNRGEVLKAKKKGKSTVYIKI